MTTAAAHTVPSPSLPTPDSTNPEAARTASLAGAPAGGGQAAGKPPAFDLLRRQMAHCGEYTYQALNKIGKLSPEDTGRITQQYLKQINLTERGQPFKDALSFLVFDGWRKDEIEARDVTLELTKGLLRYSKTKISHLSFVHQTDTPIEFYTNFPAISEICRLLRCPVVQISEKDFFMVTSINPFTATAAARIVSNEIETEVGRKPFSFVTTTDLNSWKYAFERHFGT